MARDDWKTACYGWSLKVNLLSVWLHAIHSVHCDCGAAFVVVFIVTCQYNWQWIGLQMLSWVCFRKHRKVKSGCPSKVWCATASITSSGQKVSSLVPSDAATCDPSSVRVRRPWTAGASVTWPVRIAPALQTIPAQAPSLTAVLRLQLLLLPPQQLFDCCRIVSVGWMSGWVSFCWCVVDVRVTLLVCTAHWALALYGEQHLSVVEAFVCADWAAEWVFVDVMCCNRSSVGVCWMRQSACWFVRVRLTLIFCTAHWALACFGDERLTVV